MDYNAHTKKQTESDPDVSVNKLELVPGTMPVATNHNSLDMKEVMKGHGVGDGPVHFNLDGCLGSSNDKSTTQKQLSNTPSPLSRRGPTLACGTGKPSSSAKSVPLPLCTPKPISTTETQTRSHVKTANSQTETRKMATTDLTKNGVPELKMSDDSSSSDLETCKVETLVPASPPTARNSSSVTQQTSPLGSSRLSRIRQSHLASKKKEQMKTQVTKLPDLAENSELDTLSLQSTKHTVNGSHNLDSDNTAQVKPHSSMTENVYVPSAPTDDPVTPSMPESFLKKIGLAIQSSSSDEDVSVDQLPEKEIESKFVSLSLAFKTDRLTLDQRVSVQERSRDLAEKNVDTEIQVLRDAVESLGDLATEAQIRTMLHKMKQHINILEQLVAKVSSRAEVFGAVQQERRMCKAMEVMVLYSENLRRVREKEESELQEARKLLSEKSGNGFRLDSDSGPNRRSMSFGSLNSNGRPTRRRSEVALPRVIGGTGSPSLSPSANLDPKSRFQSAVASTSMQQMITSTMRQCSQEKQRSTSISSTLSFTPPVTPVSKVLQTTSSSALSVSLETVPDHVSETHSDKQETGSTISQEEEAFRKGFREGLKAKLSQELNDLRDQQTSISHILEHVMDKVDKSGTEDEENMSRPSLFEVSIAIVSKIGGHILQYDWRSNKAAIRNLAGVIFILLAFAVIFICPPVSSEVKHFAKPSQ